MTRAEALIELHIGKKITHKYFLPEEYLIMIGPNIYTEDGIKYNMRFFTALWATDNWEFYTE
ncbi:MAG: hypothetical protein WC979_02280 [Candidatus Pacearchaeota archaeon]|jgi:hypothetical protein|nr:hypothetical protein [Clostridia bacterium]